MTTSTCYVCHEHEAIYAWQPFGPGDDYNCFTSPGSHYRGFPVIKVCDDCRTRILATLTDPFANQVVFNCQHNGYYVHNGQLKEMPF